MVDYAYAHLFEEDNVEKQWIIDYGDGVITNENLDTQSIELTESLCSESELRFGHCESSCLKFKCSDVAVSLTGKWITASIVLDSHEGAPFVVGTYKVESDKLTADRMHREVVAYDAMRGIINASVIEWYNSVFPSGNEVVSMHSFRQKFADHFGLEQSVVGNVLEDGTLSHVLVNDMVYLSKTIQVGEGTETDNGTEQVSIIKESSLSGLDVISAICEINGCFCRVNREGKLEYVYLKQDAMGLYPSETLYPGHAPDYLPQAKTLNLYPQEPDSFEIKRSCCASCKYEDYLVKPITKLQIRQNENDVGCVYPEGEISEDDNCYIIEDNFLVYGKGAEELAQIAANIFRKITDIIYRPFNAEVRGNPCVETGDAIRISTKYDIVESYVLNRTMKGGHGLMGSISSQGAEKYAEKANSVNRSIMQLRGKTNTLIRNVDETRSELASFEEDTNGSFADVRSSIKQTAESITRTVSSAVEKYDTFGYEIDLFGYEDGSNIIYKPYEHIGKYYLNQSNGNLYHSIRTSWEFVKKLDLITENLYSKIEQTANGIVSTVAGSQKLWDTEGISIDIFGYGSSLSLSEEDYKYGLMYLDQSTGIVYVTMENHPNARPPYTTLSEYARLNLITSNLKTEIGQTLSGISLKATDEDTGVSGGIDITLTSQNGTTTSEKVKINMTGAVTFTNLSTPGETVIDGGNIKADSIDASKIMAETLYVVNSLKIKHEGTMRTALSMKDVAGQEFPTLILGGDGKFANIETINDVYFNGANGIDCSKLFVRGESQFDKRINFSGSDIDLDKSGVTRGLKVINENGERESILAMNANDRTTLVGRVATSSKNETVTLLRGNTVELASAGSVTPSDERLKNSFKPLDEFDAVYMDIEPCAFRYNNGTSGRYHFGAKAQDVKRAFESHGYTTQDFGGFVQMQDNPESEDYCGVEDPMGLIYTEFTMWNMHMVQELYKKVGKQQEEIANLKEIISSLLGKDVNHEQGI